MQLAEVVADFARCLAVVDSRKPIAVNQRSKRHFQPGIGPHSESAATALVVAEMQRAAPEKYEHCRLSVPYPNLRRQRCDFCIGAGPAFVWAIEVKLLRLMGDNGKPTTTC